MAGDYYIYAVAQGGNDRTVGRSEHRVTVKHTPFLRLDALDDAVLSGADTIITGGPRPQRYVTVTWGRNGTDGDSDADDNASIDLFYSTVAAADAAGDGFSVPSGAQALFADVGEGTHVIAAGIAEDPDSRSDNSLVWDLYSLEETGEPVPIEGETYYVYGIISDSTDARLTQLNGAAARIVFQHPPAIRPLQPLSQIRVDAGRSGRVSWEDMDLDDDARIRIVLSAEDHGEMASYTVVTSGTAFIANSDNGRAQPEVDVQFDISEDNDEDFFDIRNDHLSLSINGDTPLRAGVYHVYLVIEDGESFDAATMAWRAPGQIEFTETQLAATGPRIELLPEVFSMGTGARQVVEVRVDAAGQAVDLVIVNLRLDASLFTVADQDTTRDGVQPFAVGAGFSAAKLVTNSQSVAADGSGSLFLTMEYFDPTTTAIDSLDGNGTLARFELIALQTEGNATIDLLVDPTGGRVSQLQLDGQAVFAPDPGSAATGTLVAGRGTLRGKVNLEGRTNMTSLVDFSLRSWANFNALVDSVYILANDVNENRPGVQVQLEIDGAFELRQVPTGRMDLYAHLDGYLDAWSPGLDLFPAQTLEDLRPSSSGEPTDTLMLGGDAAGYTEVDGRSMPDNEVTLADWDFVAALFDMTVSDESDSARADITGDGIVDIGDLALVGANFLGHGRRPVYKTLGNASPSRDRSVWLSPTDDETIGAGEVRVFQVEVDDLTGVRAYQLDIQFDPLQWKPLPGFETGSRVLTACSDTLLGTAHRGQPDRPRRRLSDARQRAHRHRSDRAATGQPAIAGAGGWRGDSEAEPCRSAGSALR